jgi:hypothetical protein
MKTVQESKTFNERLASPTQLLRITSIENRKRTITFAKATVLFFCCTITSLVLTSCSSVPEGKSRDDYFGYSNESPRFNKPQHRRYYAYDYEDSVPPPVTAESGGMIYDRERQLWRTPGGSVYTPNQVQQQVQGIDGQTVINNYYGGGFTNVINPWWNTTYGGWIGAPSPGISIGIGFTPWTSWNSWRRPMWNYNPYFDWGWQSQFGYFNWANNWYSPWYGFDPYWGAWQPRWSNFGGGWCTPWYAPVYTYNPNTQNDNGQQGRTNSSRTWGSAFSNGLPPNGSNVLNNPSDPRTINIVSGGGRSRDGGLVGTPNTTSTTIGTTQAPVNSPAPTRRAFNSTWTPVDIPTVTPTPSGGRSRIGGTLDAGSTQGTNPGSFDRTYTPSPNPSGSVIPSNPQSGGRSRFSNGDAPQQTPQVPQRVYTPDRPVSQPTYTPPQRTYTPSPQPTSRPMPAPTYRPPSPSPSPSPSGGGSRGGGRSR